MKTVTIEKNGKNVESVSVLIQKEGKPDKNLYTIHSKENDMVFIMRDTIDKNTGEVLKTECRGFYYGVPDVNCVMENIKHKSLIAYFDY